MVCQRLWKNQLLPGVIAVVLGIATSAYSQDASLSVSVLNLWDQTRELVRSKQLQFALEASPTQIQLLKEMLASKELIDAFNKKRSESFLQQPQKRRRARNERVRVLTAFDERIREELLKVLEPSQITALELHTRRKKFPNAVFPFMDPDVVDLCRFEGPERDAYTKKIETARVEYDTESQNLREQACKRMVESLPQPARMRLVQYIGNAYTPSIALDARLAVNDLPYPTGFVGDDAFSILIDSRKLQQELGISPQQLTALANIKEEYWTERNAIFKESLSGPETAMRLVGNLEQVGEKATKVLSSDQHLALARYMAGILFATDFVKTLSQDALLDYLELTAQERATLIGQAEDQARDLAIELSNLNEQTFQRLLSIVPEQLRLQLKELFAGTWKVD